jgi:hypothetical protein
MLQSKWGPEEEKEQISKQKKKDAGNDKRGRNLP